MAVIDGSCRERLCLEDSECPPETPECTDTGCAPCVGEVARDDQRADNPVERVSKGLCTVPFGNENANANMAGPDLRSACELHDYCYAVCGSTRAQCDDEFRSRLLETCAATYPVGPCRITCDVLAFRYAKAVADQPEAGWVGGQGRNCECGPDFWRVSMKTQIQDWS